MDINSRYKGLSNLEVIESRKRCGTNVLTPPKKIPLWKKFLQKFNDPLIKILLVAGLLSVGIALYEYFGLDSLPVVFFEPVGIFIAIFLSTGLAFYFEQNADNEFQLLNKVNDTEPIKVIREGGITEVPKCDIVVGDIVILSTGDEVPADALLLESVQLHVDESSLTGEPICYKSTLEQEQDSDATFPTNHIMRGTKIMDGHCVCRVFAVGDATENGKVFEAAQIEDNVETPLNRELDKLSKVITYLSYLVALLIIVGRVVVFINMDLHTQGLAHCLTYGMQTLMIAVTLIVVSVPEGLPMAVTLSLAYSMRRMLKTNNLVRKMHACETMGASTVICTDKTGTLTRNQMRVYDTKFYNLKERGISETLLLEGISINTTAEIENSNNNGCKVLGNPTEGALLLWLMDRGVDYRAERAKFKVLKEIPFSTEKKYMATVVDTPDGKLIHVKGAPEIVYSLCNNSDVNRAEVEADLEGYQAQGMRTLGFAYKRIDGEVDEDILLEGLVFMGIVAISDPVREDVKEAIEVCINAGIDIKIVTGDTPITAKEIARQIGLYNIADLDEAIITGPEFAALTKEELLERVDKLRIVARARPMDKKRLVEILQSKGEVVAVTGDGTNDAPALNVAHVGLSMGDGTAVAKQASDITITDNSFSSIGRAVMWGRSLYKNIQRFLLFQLTVNVAASFIVLFGAFMGVESPLTVTQMLWVNLIMDTFGAMALASLPPSKDVMREKPRDRNASIITRAMEYNLFGVGFIFFAITLLFLYIFQHSNVDSLTDLFSLELGVKGAVTPYEQTLLFSIFVWTHFWYMFNARSFGSKSSYFKLNRSKEFNFIVGVIVVGQIVIVELLYNFFNVHPMFHTTNWGFNLSGLIDWLLIVVISSSVLWVHEAWCFFVQRKS